MNNRETIQELADLFIGGGFECETPEEEQMLIWVKEQMNILNVEEILENFVLGGFPVKDDDRFLACSSILTQYLDKLFIYPTTIDTIINYISFTADSFININN